MQNFTRFLVVIVLVFAVQKITAQEDLNKDKIEELTMEYNFLYIIKFIYQITSLALHRYKW